jgi:hypothetical protein
MKIPVTPRPKWSPKSSFLMGVGISIIVTITVLFTLKRSIWTELEIITVVLAFFMFAFLMTALYLGVRFDKRERFSIDWPKGSPSDLIDASGYVPGDTSGFFTEAGAEAGILGIIFGFILDILVTIILIYLVAFIIWLGLNVFLAAILSVSLPLFYFYRRTLREIVARGKYCRGHVIKSAMLALKSALGYSIWFYTIFFMAHQIEQMHGN